MDIKRFKSLSEEKPKRIAVGELFLEGKYVIAQKENKEVGDRVVYFEVTEIKENGNYEYKPVYEVLTGKNE